MISPISPLKTIEKPRSKRPFRTAEVGWPEIPGRRRCGGQPPGTCRRRRVGGTRTRRGARGAKGAPAAGAHALEMTPRLIFMDVH